MYKVGQYIIYGFEGVCRVESIGPVDIKGAQKDVNYYTLAPVYQHGKLYVPVETTAYSRPVMTKEEAEALIAEIPNIPCEMFESSNPRWRRGTDWDRWTSGASSRRKINSTENWRWRWRCPFRTSGSTSPTRWRANI